VKAQVCGILKKRVANMLAARLRLKSMNRLTSQELAAVGGCLKAIREGRVDSARTRLKVDNQRIPVDVITLQDRGAGRRLSAMPHLRFDKVATRLVEQLRAKCEEIVPNGITVLLAVTAPIRMAAKTIAAVEERMSSLLIERARDAEETVYGNRVRLRILRSLPEPAPKLIGFVHNPETDPLQLFNLTSELFETIGILPEAKIKKVPNDRWLIAISSFAGSSIDAYRTILTQLVLQLYLTVLP
jgi:hypothetical protein